MNNNEKSQKSHYCKICDKTILGGKFNFKSHLYQHGVIRPRFKCALCSKEYFRRDTYDKHRLAHAGIAKKQFICDHCDRSFVDKRNLILHLKIHDDLYVMPRLEFKCTACGVVYCENRLLKHHIRKHHFGMTEEKKPNFMDKKCNETWVERVRQTEVYVQMTKINENVLQIKKCDVKKELKCVEQNLEFVNIFKGEDKLGYSKAICDYCKKEMLKKSIELHIRKTHFKQNFKCPKCNLYFMSHFLMENHICNLNSVLKDKSQYSEAICDYCGKAMLKKSLKSHIRERHLKLKRFKCQDCNESFNRHYQMVNHICGKYKSRKGRKFVCKVTGRD